MNIHILSLKRSFDMSESILDSYRYSAEIINKYINGRTLIFYGDNTDYRELIREEFGMESSFSLTSIEKKADSSRVFINSLKGRADEFYIVIPKELPSAALHKTFRGLGFREFKDYLFVKRNKTTIAPGSPDYRDEYGNFVHAGGCTVSLGQYVRNSFVKVDDSFKGEFKIRLFGNGCAHVEIGAGCKSSGMSRAFIHDNGILRIGNDVSIGDNTKISIMENNRVNIGNDCMFSYDILLFCGDGHAIFDMETGQRTNLYLDDDTKGTITLGDHVWVGAGCYILNRAKIGDSCIIGAGSTFKGELPDYCVAAGNPARIVKKNVTWSRNPNAREIGECFLTWQSSSFGTDDDEEEP